MLKTRITDFSGIERPIVQGGLMWIGRSELASAVGNAGGIGFMTALTFPEPEGLRAEIRKCREMTDKPFGINLTFLPSLRQPDYPAYIDVCIPRAVHGSAQIRRDQRYPQVHFGKARCQGRENWL